MKTVIFIAIVLMLVGCGNSSDRKEIIDGKVIKGDQKGTLLEKIVSGDDTYDNPIIFFYYFKK